MVARVGGEVKTRPFDEATKTLDTKTLGLSVACVWCSVLGIRVRLEGVSQPEAMVSEAARLGYERVEMSVVTPGPIVERKIIEGGSC